MPNNLTLYSSGLLSKWGFGDGDVVWDYLFDELGIDGLDDDRDLDRRLLERLVTKHIVPKLDQKVEVWVIGTHHNPVRANTVDGLDVNWYTPSQEESALTPEVFEFTPEFILAELDAVRKEPVVVEVSE